MLSVRKYNNIVKLFLIAILCLFLLSSCNSKHGEKNKIPQKSNGNIKVNLKKTNHVSELPVVPKYQKGVNLLLYGQYSDISSISNKLFQNLKRIGVNSINLNFPFYMKDLNSSSVYTNNVTPTNKEIGIIISEAHKYGLYTNIRPILDGANLGTGWRGVIAPNNVNNWFKSYTQMIVGYAKLSQEIGANTLTIGVELTSMDGYTANWDNLISQVRDVFKGNLTYSSNWTPQIISTSVQFWNKLNFISTDVFIPVHGTVISSMAQQIVKSLTQFNAVYADYKIPIIVSEVGATSQVGSYKEPWVWNVGTPYSGSSQADYYKAFFMALKYYSCVSGVYIWDIPYNQLLGNYNPQTDIGYNPLGKKAEVVMQQEFY